MRFLFPLEWFLNWKWAKLGLISTFQDLEVGPRLAWSNDSQHPVDLNWRFPYSLGSKGHLFYPLFFFYLNSDFRPYFLPLIPSLPHFGTSVEAERHCSSLQDLQPKEVENLHASEGSVFIRGGSGQRNLNALLILKSFFFYIILAITLSNFSSEILQILELFWLPWSSSHHTPTHPTSETDSIVQKEANDLTPRASGTGCVVHTCLTPF